MQITSIAFVFLALAQTPPAPRDTPQTPANRGAPTAQQGQVGYQATDKQHKEFAAQRASTLRGSTIYDGQGREAAELVDFLIRGNDGHIDFAIVDLRGESGMREGKVLVPFQTLQITPGAENDKPRLMMRSTAADLATATAYADGDEAKAGWSPRGTGQMGDARGNTNPQRPNNEPGVNPDGRARPVEASAPAATSAAGMHLRLETLKDHKVKATEDGELEDIGEIDELIIDTKTGCIAYAVVGVGGFMGMGERNVAVPFGAFQVRETEDSEADDRELSLVLNTTRDSLDNAPEWDNNQWTTMRSPAFLERVYQHHRVQPYWNKQGGAMNGDGHGATGGMGGAGERPTDRPQVPPRDNTGGGQG